MGEKVEGIRKTSLNGARPLAMILKLSARLVFGLRVG
jgi:hypothetical protein